MSSSAQISAARDKLAERLCAALGADVGDSVMYALEEYCEVLVDAAVTDLTHRINKTGEYSPDY